MELHQLLRGLNKNAIQQLAQAETVDALREKAAQLGHHIAGEEAEAVFAALYPVRGVEQLDEEMLQVVQGGLKPRDTQGFTINKKNDIKII